MEKDPWCSAGFNPIYNVTLDNPALESIMRQHLCLPWNILLHHKRYHKLTMYKECVQEDKYWLCYILLNKCFQKHNWIYLHWLEGVNRRYNSHNAWLLSMEHTGNIYIYKINPISTSGFWKSFSKNGSKVAYQLRHHSLPVH